MIYKINQAITETILVLDSTGTAVTGLTDGDFSKELLRNKSSSSDSITITEKGNGYYYVDFTPTSTGIYFWKITHATYEPNGWYDYYRVITNDTDDIKSETSNIYTDTQNIYTDTQAIQTTQTAQEVLLNRILGLSQENTYMDSLVYDGSGNLTSARIRVYSDAASVASGSNITATYTMTGTYSGTNLDTYKVVKQ
jgi:hypothetical protein